MNFRVVFFNSVIKFLSPRDIFAYLHRRYPSTVISSFRKLLKCRGKRLSIRLEIHFLRKCLHEGVAPKSLSRRVSRARVKYSRKMEIAFIQDELNFLSDRLVTLQDEHGILWKKLMQQVGFLDGIRMCSFMSYSDSCAREEKRSKHSSYLRRLQQERFGNMQGQYSNVFNLANVELSTLEKEVLSRGLDFGIPRRTNREEIFAEFELFYQQLTRHEPSSLEDAEECRTKLASIADSFHNTPNDRQGFSLKAEHFKTIKSLKSNDTLVITRPDKGKGVVILDKADYVEKMMHILDDTTKFSRLGPCESHDNTARKETSLQTFLRKLNKDGEISDEVYQQIRPTGSVRPRMYGVPKVHKEGTPLRPILSMIGSPQHATAQWLATVLKPVSCKYSKFVVKDSFEFSRAMRDLTVEGDSCHMCSFDIKSLFTNVPIDETIRICIQQLYHSDLECPSLSEKSLEKLLRMVTTGVEFSFNGTMFKQVDGVAMGSPLGPVLANIFVGFYEQQLPIDKDKSSLAYRRYVDDTFSLNINREAADDLLGKLNNLHPALQFTCEHEENSKLPFLDALVHKEHQQNNRTTVFSTSVYRKPTFTGQYIRWDSFSSKQHKINLIKCLVNRATKICSPCWLEPEIHRIKDILATNGYPTFTVDKVIKATLHPRALLIGPKRCPVFLRLPWIGNSASGNFEKKIKRTVQPVFRTCDVRMCFTSKPVFPPCVKDIIPAHSKSNVIYLFECRCGHRYVGKTTQRLETRISQHLPAVLKSTRRPGTSSSKPPDSAIGQHLLSSTSCLDTFSRSLFTIVASARSSQVLHYLEPLYIKKLKPTLCKQLEFVKSLHLFS